MLLKKSALISSSKSADKQYTRPLVVNQSWIVINFEEQRGPTAERNGLFFPPRSKCLILSFYDFPRPYKYFDVTWKSRQNFSNTHLGFDLHFDMQKLIPQTQLLMCRIQFKEKKKSKKENINTRWCSPFLRTIIKGKWCNWQSVMWLAQFCTHLLHHLLIFVIKPRVVLGTEQSIVQYRVY